MPIISFLRKVWHHRVAQLSGAIGAGIYCRSNVYPNWLFQVAENSATSSAYVGYHSDSKKMLMCRVVLGDVGPGAYGLRRPPPKRHGTEVSTIEKRCWHQFPALHDSVGNGGGVFVVFDNRQTYAEYIITYYLNSSGFAEQTLFLVFATRILWIHKQWMLQDLQAVWALWWFLLDSWDSIEILRVHNTTLLRYPAVPKKNLFEPPD